MTESFPLFGYDLALYEELFEEKLNLFADCSNRSPLGLSRFDLKYSNGTLPHEALMKSLELYGTKVVPMVRDRLA